MFDLFVLSQKFSPSYSFRRSASEYLRKRNYDREDFFKKAKYWERRGYINYFVEGKERYLELTKKGKKYLRKKPWDDIKIKRPQKWDGKWRIIIFDIPEKMRHQRNVIRDKLKALDFYKIQLSVYVYPFECSKEVREISKRLFVEDDVLIMISEIIQGEKRIIDHYFRRGILKKSDLT